MVLTYLGKKSRMNNCVDSKEEKSFMPLRCRPRKCVSEGFIPALFHDVTVELKSVRDLANERGNLLTLTSLDTQ